MEAKGMTLEDLTKKAEAKAGGKDKFQKLSPNQKREMEIQTLIDEDLDTYYGIINKVLSENDAFKNLVNLEVDESSLNSFNAASWNEIISDEDAATLGYESAHAFVQSYYDKARDWLDNGREKITDAFGENINSSIIDKANTAAEKQNVYNMLNEVNKNGGNVSDFSNIIGKALNKASEEEVDEIFKQIGLTNFTKKSEVKEFAKYLADLGPNFKELSAEILQASKAIETLSAASMVERYKTANEILEKVRGNETSNFSEDEMKKLIELGIDSDKFVFNGTDYTYIGESMDELERAIIENTTAIREESRQRLEERINNANNIGSLDTIADITGNTQFSDRDIASGAIFSMQGLSDETSRKDIAQKAGLYEEGMTDYQIKEAIKTALTDYLNIESLKTEAKSYDTNTTVASAFQSNSVAANQGSKLTSEYQNKNGNKYAYSENDDKALIALAKRYQVAEQEVNNFTEALKSGNAEQKNAARLALVNATELKRQEARYTETYKKLQDVDKIYKDTTKSSHLFGEAVQEYGKALNLDMSDQTNVDVLTNNYSLLQKAIDGNVDSMIALNNKLAEAHGFTIGVDGDFTRYNTEVDIADEKTQKFIMDQYEAGAYEIETIYVTQDADYIVPTGYDADGHATGFETRNIKAGSTVQVLKHASAPSVASSMAKGGGGNKKKGGGGGGGSKHKAKDNPYDKLYNLTQEIEEETRTRTNLEKQLNRIVNSRLDSAKSYLQVQKDILKSLDTQRKEQERLLEGRREQIEELSSLSYINSDGKKTSFKGMDQYIHYDFDKGVLVQDYEKISKLYEKNDYKTIETLEAWQKKYEEYVSSYEQTQDAIEDIKDNVKSIVDEIIDNRISYIEAMRDAYKEVRQREIDDLSKIYDAIADANSELLEGIQKAVDDQRQDRDNQEALSDIEKAQRRLAILRSDSSGANALEIKALEESIKDMQQNYTDNLIDQKINELQDQNDQAADQRDRQIELMQRQLDWMEESGMITQIIEAMDEAEATALWQEYKKFNYTSEIEKLSYMREFRELWNKGGDTTANNAYVAAADSATYGDTYTLTDKTVTL